MAKVVAVSLTIPFSPMESTVKGNIVVQCEKSGTLKGQQFGGTGILVLHQLLFRGSIEEDSRHSEIQPPESFV
jgi:hypothetical protein